MKLYREQEVPIPNFGEVLLFRSKANGFLYYKKNSSEVLLLDNIHGIFFIPDKTVTKVINFTGENIETSVIDTGLLIQFYSIPSIIVGGGGGGSKGSQGFQGAQGAQGPQGSGVSQLSFQEFDVSYTDFQPNAGNNSNFLIGTVPRAAVIIGAKIKATVQWASSSDTSATMSVNGNDVTGNPTSIAVVNCTANFMNALSDTVGSYNLQFSSTKILNHSNPANMYANVFVSGGAGNIDLLIAGQAKIWLLIMQAF